jgi:GNAT superfamily N-acetyltransferase
MSSTKLDLQQLNVKQLEEQTNLSGFDCSKDDTLGSHDFIHKDAKQYQKECMGSTYMFHFQNVFVGYVTVAMHAIEVKNTRLRIVTNMKSYPALLLGRLGVHNDHRNRNIGRSICLWTIGFAKEFSQEVGCRFVVVLTSPDKVAFYEKCGFAICPKHERKKKVLMYFQIF